MIDRREFLTEIAVGCLAMPLLTKPEINGNYLKTEVLRVDHVNGNKRIYPRKVVEKAIADKQQLLGEFWTDGVHRKEGTIHFANVSHEIKNLYLEDDCLMADIQILQTPRGRILKDLLQETAFRPFGIGSGKVNDDGIFVINDNYKLISIDAMPAKVAAKL